MIGYLFTLCFSAARSTVWQRNAWKLIWIAVDVQWSKFHPDTSNNNMTCEMNYTAIVYNMAFLLHILYNKKTNKPHKYRISIAKEKLNIPFFK